MKRVEILKYFLITICLFLGLLCNFAARISKDGYSNFDWWSEGYLISDVMYDQNYEKNEKLLQCISPTQICSQNWQDAEGVLAQRFAEGKPFEREYYSGYTSNIVIQRYFYRWLGAILPVSNKVLLDVWHTINAFLAACVISIILMWIGRETSYAVALITAVVLGTGSPYFAMYGKNLYWCMWTIFLPMAGMILAVRKTKKASSWGMIAFLLCFVKQIFYFEFVSTVMISMMIPIFYYCIHEKIGIKETLKKTVVPTMGAILSFICVFGIKLIWLSDSFGFKEAWNLAFSNVLQRTMGGGGFETEKIPYTELFWRMSTKTMISLKNWFSINMLSGICIVVLIFIWYLIWYRRKAKENDMAALLYATLISVAAPFSWFILAAPHATVHGVHCSITWFCPFVIMLFGLVGKTIYEMRELGFGLPKCVREFLLSYWLMAVVVLGMAVFPIIHKMSSRWIVYTLWSYAKYIYLYCGLYIVWFVINRLKRGSKREKQTR